MRKYFILLICGGFFLGFCIGVVCQEKSFYKQELTYPIVDTGQVFCYNTWKIIYYPKAGWYFHGQDAQFQGNVPSYKDNGNGTVTDLNTGLIWSKAVNKKKVSLIEAKRIAKSMRLAGYNDWRVPTIKELYSLIDFRGYTGFATGGSYSMGMRRRGYQRGGMQSRFRSIPSNAVPFINTDYFDFEFGQINNGERYIDAQWLSSTEYVSTTMGGAKTLFGVNFADGRIKGYGYARPNYGLRKRREKKFYVRFVRGNKQYGKNKFVDNGDGTVTDKATGLTWMKYDSKKAMSWFYALKYAENLKYAGHSDWRLPNAKELQSIVDYTRSPDTTNSAAIDPVFSCTPITNEARKKDYPCYWTSTTHLDGPYPASNAAYVAFGRAMGKMHGRIMDVHGAGAQRSDPKYGRPAIGHGPQGDARRVYNFVRCVRGGVKKRVKPVINTKKYPYTVRSLVAKKQKETRVSSSSSTSSGYRRQNQNSRRRNPWRRWGR